VIGRTPPSLPRLAALATIAALSACAGVEGRTDLQPVPTITLTPQELTARVGDSIAVLAAIDEPPRRSSTARWRSEQPAIVRLDTTVAPGRIATGVAVAPGSAVLMAWLTHYGQTVGAAVPVTVLPR
jgi:hypothetical protein